MDALRGFDSLRTRPALPRECAPKRRCPSCNAVLRPSNPGDTCAPCLRGEIDIPDWAITLVEADPSAPNIAKVAAVLTGQPRPNRYNQETFEARNATIRELAATGMSQRDIADAYGLKRTGVEMILRRGKGEPKEAKKAARQSGPGTKSELSITER